MATQVSPDAQTLAILVDVRSRLAELVQSQQEFVKLRQEVNSTGNMLRTGLGIDLARRGLDILTGTVRELAVEAVNLADKIKDGARNLTLSNQAYQVLGNLLQDAGGDVSMLTQAISNNTRSLVEARTAGTAASAAYRTLGLNVAQLAALPIERRFELIARAVANATDQDKAYSAAGQILVSRGLPTLLGALKDLAADGWDKVTEAQLRAGRVMTDDTIVRLEAAKKSIEKLKQSSTIAVGEWLGDAMSLGQAIKRVFDTLPFAVAGSIIKPGSTGKLFGQVWHEFIKEPGIGEGAPKSDGAGAAAEIALKDAMTKAEINLSAAMLHRQTVEDNPTLTDYRKEKDKILLMQQELDLREKLIEATKAAPVETGETQDTRNLKVRKLEEQNQQLRNQLLQLNSATQFNQADQATRDKYDKFAADGGMGSPNIKGSLKLGAMDWITSLGSKGEQISSALQNTLGTTVQGIGDGIYGWITNTQSFGDTLLQLGDTVFKTILNTIVQMGVQWLVNTIIMKTSMLGLHALGEVLRLQRTTATAAEGATTTAALAPAAATASISSFGLAAVLGIAALVAALALFGGFAAGGYTGDMARNSVAGVVHGQEYVLNAAATSRLGTGFLDRVNAGAPLSVAGAPAILSGGSGAAGTTAAAGGGANVSVAVFMDETAAMAWLGTRKGKKILYRKLGQDRGEMGIPS